MSPPPPIRTPVARSVGLRARRDLGDSERRGFSALIGARLLDIGEIRAANSVAGYVALPDEVDLSAFLEEATELGAQLHLPRVVGDELEFAGWSGGEELLANTFGIAEPRGVAVELGALEVIVLPCVAVDPAGTRVGFGSGYYDRALAGLPEDLDGRPLLVGVAFEVQCLDSIERRDWDVPLDVVVTESRTIRPTHRP